MTEGASVAQALRTTWEGLGAEPVRIIQGAGLHLGPMPEPVVTAPPGTLLPLAEGMRLATPETAVVVIGTDDDLYGPCLGDLIHAAKRNTGLTCIVIDDGMAGPIALVGEGEVASRPISLLLAAGSTFAAQVPAFAEAQLGRVIREALVHPGFALVNILTGPQAAAELVDVNEDPTYDKHALHLAMDRSLHPEHQPIGMIYQQPERAAFEALLIGQVPLVTAVWTPDADDWERILSDDEEDEDEGGGNG
jgi:hypothetical protein